MEWPYLSEEKESLSSLEIRVSANPGSVPRFSFLKSGLSKKPGSVLRLSSQEIRASANPGSLPRFSSPESSLFLNPGSMSSFSSLESKTPSNPDSEFALPSQKK